MNPQSISETWVYLSASPLIGLTLTLLAYQLSLWLYKRSGHRAWANPVLVAIFLITLPIFMKLCPMYGVDMVNFGVVMTLLIMIGNLTPPVGMCLFAVDSFARTGVWPLTANFIAV